MVVLGLRPRLGFFADEFSVPVSAVVARLEGELHGSACFLAWSLSMPEK